MHLDRLEDSIQKLFRSTTTPTSSYGLQELAALFGGTQNKGRFLRLDGPAIFLIVATTLQFPYSSMLNKLIFFFAVGHLVSREAQRLMPALGTISCIQKHHQRSGCTAGICWWRQSGKGGPKAKEIHFQAAHGEVTGHSFPSQHAYQNQNIGRFHKPPLSIRLTVIGRSPYPETMHRKCRGVAWPDGPNKRVTCTLIFMLCSDNY